MIRNLMPSFDHTQTQHVPERQRPEMILIILARIICIKCTDRPIAITITHVINSLASTNNSFNISRTKDCHYLINKWRCREREVAIKRRYKIDLYQRVSSYLLHIYFFIPYCYETCIVVGIFIPLIVFFFSRFNSSSNHHSSSAPHTPILVQLITLVGVILEAIGMRDLMLTHWTVSFFFTIKHE